MPLCKETIAPVSMFIRPWRRSGNPWRLKIMIAAIAFSCVPIYACKSAPPAPVAPPPEPVSRVSADEPSKELPGDLFKSMPIYPGAVVQHVKKPKGAMREITFSTPAQLNQIVTFYRDQLRANDFHITSSLIMPARKTWSCDFHKNGRPATITLYPDDQDKSKMTIDLIYELPAKPEEGMQEAEEKFDVIGPGEVAQQATNSNPKTKRN